jgi:hypothetical protein
MVRIFLAIVGAAYIALAAWCAIRPEMTSKSVGFVLQSGSGQSEFLTVYGGLQFALGVAFLWPLLRPSESHSLLLLCLLLHGSLVLFRSAGFLVFSGFPSMTYYLAATEWVIFLG